MNPRFKEQLLSLGGNRAARQYMAHFRLDTPKLVAFGSYGETGDNYYLYIYRDFFTPTGEYQAMLFLYRALNWKNRSILSIPTTTWTSSAAAPISKPPSTT